MSALALAFHFRVTFGSAGQGVDSSFREVSGIAPEMETEAVREGGENRYVLSLPKGVKAPRLVLKRGIAAGNSKLLTWCKSTLEGGLSERIKPQQVNVSLLNEKGEPLETWSMMNAYPVKLEVEGFNATRNEVAIERIELNYTHCKRG
jgi:phage tail-like protein